MCAGPAPLPAAVIREVQDEILDYGGLGVGIMSLSHRSPEFGVVFDDAIAALRRVLEIPATHEVLFAHGGGHGQFAAVPLNLCEAGKEGSTADYIVGGTWAKRAAAEAAKYTTVRIAAESAGDRLPPREEWALDPTASYRYICSNETVNGLEYHALPTFDDGVPLVVDMSSDIGSKKIDWSAVGAAFACAPKNIGHAGLTVVVVDRALMLGRQPQELCPGVLSWRTNFESGGMWNTPPTFNIYTTGKVMLWLEAQGGLGAAEALASAKASAFYAAIDGSGGFYATPVPSERSAERSRMNAPFNVAGGDEAATTAFLRAAYEANMVGFRTNTPFGYGDWLRASFYTGTPLEHVHKLVGFMRDFAERWQAAAAKP